MVQPSARAIPPRPTEPSSGALRSTRSTRSRPNLTTGGYRHAATSGVTASTHQYCLTACAETSGSVTPAATSPTTSVTAMLTRLAVALRRRGTA